VPAGKFSTRGWGGRTTMCRLFGASAVCFPCSAEDVCLGAFLWLPAAACVCRCCLVMCVQVLCCNVCLVLVCDVCSGAACLVAASSLCDRVVGVCTTLTRVLASSWLSAARPPYSSSAHLHDPPARTAYCACGYTLEAAGHCWKLLPGQLCMGSHT
jgi:hypothetical protein